MEQSLDSLRKSKKMAGLELDSSKRTLKTLLEEQVPNYFPVGARVRLSAEGKLTIRKKFPNRGVAVVRKTDGPQVFVNWEEGAPGTPPIAYHFTFLEKV